VNITAKSLKATAANALVLLFVVCAFAQDGAAPRPKHATLPRSFADLSADDVLGRVFDAYDARTGRVATMLNGEKRAALVRIREARAWYALGRENLVVLVDLAGTDYDLEDLCGNCAMYALLAVLKRDGRALTLVARQDVPASAVAGEESTSGGASDEAFAPFFISGHDPTVKLDLAPYCFNERETLVGIRREHMWLPAQDYATDLTLYRVEGARLRQVFAEPVVEREYPRGASKGMPVIKTTSLISPRAGGGEFYDLVIEKTTARCIDNDDDADCTRPREPARVVKKSLEVWSFDGKSFQRTNKPAPPAPSGKAACGG
jgi:hypothetical protein